MEWVASSRWLPGITHGIKQIVEYAAIAAIRRRLEHITVPLLSSWRDIFEPLAERRPPASEQSAPLTRDMRGRIAVDLKDASLSNVKRPHFPG